MLKHIEPSCYDEEKYEATKKWYQHYFEHIEPVVHYAGHDTPTRRAPGQRVRGAILLYFPEDVDDEGMDKFIVLVAGMLWAIDNGGISDDDPADIAYNTWDVLKDFSTGNYDDLFTPEDLVLIKKDVATLYDYFDKHPALKGD